MASFFFEKEIPAFAAADCAMFSRKRASEAMLFLTKAPDSGMVNCVVISHRVPQEFH